MSSYRWASDAQRNLASSLSPQPTATNCNQPQPTAVPDFDTRTPTLLGVANRSDGILMAFSWHIHGVPLRRRCLRIRRKLQRRRQWRLLRCPSKLKRHNERISIDGYNSFERRRVSLSSFPMDKYALSSCLSRCLTCFFFLVFCLFSCSYSFRSLCSIDVVVSRILEFVVDALRSNLSVSSSFTSWNGFGFIQFVPKCVQSRRISWSWVFS